MKISIVIPIYNKEKYVEVCFESLLKQDFDEFEIVAINENTEGNMMEGYINFIRKRERRNQLIIIL